MASYFYPTSSGWFEKLLEKWKKSGKRTLVIPFVRFKPTTLPTNRREPFWMYLYYTKSRTEEVALQCVVKFRVRVVRYDFSIIQGADIHPYTEAGATVWFQCDLVEEIKCVNGSALRGSDFKHLRGVSLPHAVRNSIAPVKRVTPIVTVQSTWCCIND